MAAVRGRDEGTRAGGRAGRKDFRDDGKAGNFSTGLLCWGTMRGLIGALKGRAGGLRSPAVRREGRDEEGGGGGNRMADGGGRE